MVLDLIDNSMGLIRAKMAKKNSEHIVHEQQSLIHKVYELYAGKNHRPPATESYSDEIAYTIIGRMMRERS